MNHSLRIIHRIIYYLFGLLLLLFSIFSIFNKSCAEVYSPNSYHLMRELGIAYLFVGLVSLWCGYRMTYSKEIRILLIVFFLLFAGFHWVEFASGNRTLTSPLLNSIPAISLTPLHFLTRKTPSVEESTS